MLFEPKDVISKMLPYSHNFHDQNGAFYENYPHG
jgi:hypothetical protein